jgi:hypothetical protein
LGSLERADGFRHKAEELDEEIRRIRRLDSVNVKRDILKKLQEEYDLYKGMYVTELDIYNGHISRGIRKFLLNEDGYTYKLNPKWRPTREEDV